MRLFISELRPFSWGEPVRCSKKSSPTPLWGHRLPVTALALKVRGLIFLIFLATTVRMWRHMWRDIDGSSWAHFETFLCSMFTVREVVTRWWQCHNEINKIVVPPCVMLCCNSSDSGWFHKVCIYLRNCISISEDLQKWAGCWCQHLTFPNQVFLLLTGRKTHKYHDILVKNLYLLGTRIFVHFKL